MVMASKVEPPFRPAPGSESQVRVMVADDSAVVRGFIVRMLEADPQIRVVASVSNGAHAVDRFSRSQDIDVIVLDIEMPVMDGLAALPKLLAVDSSISVVMASTLTTHNAEITLQALQAGAADYVPKPSSRQLGGDGAFRRELVEKVKALAASRSRRAPVRAERTTLFSATRSESKPGGRAAVVDGARAAFTLRASTRTRPDVVAIGSSTGGPQALVSLLRELQPAKLSQPVLITQHMPPTFTSILADHLQRASGAPCAEAVSGEMLSAGRVYVAPGDWHMMVESASGGVRIRLNQDPPENFCRPAVDPLFRSIASVYGGRSLAIVLTGMGSDGLEGARRLVAAGGNLVAQDQSSSVVWGMPGAVAMAGLCCAVEPLNRIAERIQEFCRGFGK